MKHLVAIILFVAVAQHAQAAERAQRVAQLNQRVQSARRALDSATIRPRLDAPLHGAVRIGAALAGAEVAWSKDARVSTETFFKRGPLLHLALPLGPQLGLMWGRGAKKAAQVAAGHAPLPRLEFTGGVGLAGWWAVLLRTNIGKKRRDMRLALDGHGAFAGIDVGPGLNLHFGRKVPFVSAKQGKVARRRLEELAGQLGASDAELETIARHLDVLDADIQKVVREAAKERRLIGAAAARGETR